MDRETANEITGGLSNPSKMPGYGYGIPATACKVGAALHKLEGTTCSDCYALKGMYHMPNVKRAMAIRLASLSHPHWVEAMAFLIHTVSPRHRTHFRWHDSGDLQSLDHLMRIVEVCELTPDVMHYLPTRETGVVKSYARNFGNFPTNLVVRLSAPLIDGPPPTWSGLTSTVHENQSPVGFACPAREKYQNTCGPCRACWDATVVNISYPRH